MVAGGGGGATEGEAAVLVDSYPISVKLCCSVPQYCTGEWGVG